MSAGQDTATRRWRPRKRAGAFDVRTVIGLLLGIYGVVLVVMGLVGTSEEDLAKADGTNVNLLTGIGLVVAAGVFLVWARLRPILVPVTPPEEDGGHDGSPPPH